MAIEKLFSPVDTLDIFKIEPVPTLENKIQKAAYLLLKIFRRLVLPITTLVGLVLFLTVGFTYGEKTFLLKLTVITSPLIIPITFLLSRKLYRKGYNTISTILSLLIILPITTVILYIIFGILI